MTLSQQLAGAIAAALVLLITRLIDKYTGTTTPPAPGGIDKPSQPADPTSGDGGTTP